MTLKTFFRKIEIFLRDRKKKMKTNIRLLIVDDNEGVRNDLKSVLQMTAGIEVVGIAENGREAVEQVKKVNPDVVLMDLEMPIMDGLKATQEIKSLGLGTRVIVFSLYSGEIIRQKVMISGADGFVEKGAPVGELQKILWGNK
jgi:DNA-binding NarL/FixJ family response regulator